MILRYLEYLSNRGRVLKTVENLVVPGTGRDGKNRAPVHNFLEDLCAGLENW